MPFYSLFKIYIGRKLTRFKIIKKSQKSFYSITLIHAYLQYACFIPAKYQKDTLKALGGVDFTKSALSAIIQYMKCLKKSYDIFFQKSFFSTILLHAHLQYACNIPAKYQKDTLKAQGGVDFTNCALHYQPLLSTL